MSSPVCETKCTSSVIGGDGLLHVIALFVAPGPIYHQVMLRLTRREPVALLMALTVLVSACSSSPSSSDLDELPLAGSRIDVGEPARFEQGTHCGFRVLDTMINGHVWRAEGASDVDWFPSGWRPDSSTPDGPVAIQLVLAEDETTIVASRNSTEVTYQSGGTEWQNSDLCS
ncbi:hypothetical protein [Ilumatobacter sp.]|uniref:hypothetical protein n=1 Tax=Ilumatobacter sp. TaxID=1967498 RepID=UPI003C3BD884